MALFHFSCLNIIAPFPLSLICSRAVKSAHNHKQISKTPLWVRLTDELDEELFSQLES